MARFAFSYVADEAGLTVALHRKAMLRGSQAVPPERWADEMGDAAFSGVAHLLSLLDADDGRAARDNDGIRLVHSAVAALTEPQANSLGLPPAVPLILNLRAEI